jgi:4-amino-4-deoxy-L-arabinose transferase-like glycosyltransferase
VRLARHPRAIEASLFALGLAVMGLVLAYAPNSLRPTPSYNDYLSFYKPVAANLVAGKGFIGLNGLPALHDPPGYPLILAFVFWLADGLHLGREGMVNVATVVTLALACVLVYRVARAMFGQKVGVVAALLWLTYPIEMLMAPYRFSEVPFTPILYLTALVFIDGAVRGLPSWRRMAMVGVLIGADALIRPQAILLVVPYGLALWAHAHHLRRSEKDTRDAATAHRRRATVGLCAVMVVAYLGTVAPWEIWVKARTGQTIALSDGGPSAILNGLTVGLHPIDERGHVSLPSGVVALEKRVQAHQATLTTVGKIAHFMGGQLLAHPLPVVALIVFKAASSFYGTNSLTHEPLIALIQLPYLGFMIAGLVLAWRSGGVRRRVAVLAIAVVGYMWIMTIAVLSIVRYMGPALGLLIPFAALALVRSWEWLQARRLGAGAAEPRADVT